MSELARFSIGLCGPGQHDMPVEDYIFDSPIKDPFDFKWQLAQVEAWAKSFAVARRTQGYEPDDEFIVDLHITGLTSILVSTMQVFHKLEIRYTLLHHNRNTNEYEMQVVNIR